MTNDEFFAARNERMKNGKFAIRNS